MYCLPTVSRLCGATLETCTTVNNYRLLECTCTGSDVRTRVDKVGSPNCYFCAPKATPPPPPPATCTSVAEQCSPGPCTCPSNKVKGQYGSNTGVCYRCDPTTTTSPPASKSCSQKHANGQCWDGTTITCSVAYESGLCPGATNIRCCPSGRPGSSPPSPVTPPPSTVPTSKCTPYGATDDVDAKGVKRCACGNKAVCSPKNSGDSYATGDCFVGLVASNPRSMWRVGECPTCKCYTYVTQPLNGSIRVRVCCCAPRQCRMGAADVQ